MDENNDLKAIVRPKAFSSPAQAEKFRNLHEQIREHGLMSRTTAMKKPFKSRVSPGSLSITLDEIQAEMMRHSFEAADSGYLPLLSSEQSETISSTSKEETSAPAKHIELFIKVTLRVTETIVLYEQASITELRDTEEGQLVEVDNQRYEYLTTGKGKLRHRLEAVTQTTNLLVKTRSTNTENIRSRNKASYVSIFEMFDTYKDLETSTKNLQVEGSQDVQVTTYKMRGVDSFAPISSSPNFKLALMLMTRVLAGNKYEHGQRRFRNMNMPDPLALEAQYRYRLDELWQYCPQLSVDERNSAVADISWCPSNGDILAVAYGIYTFSAMNVPRSGSVCIWNIKNPVNPERVYKYVEPVSAVEFSQFMPQLLAIGLYDGSVEVRDITIEGLPPVAISERTTSPNFEPVTAFRWLSEESLPIDTVTQDFLALSQNGSVTKYRLISGPYLLGFQQMILHRIEGSVEGLPMERTGEEIQSNRHPQGLNLTMHPLQSDIYYILTDEGCLHKCSTNYPQQHIDVIQVHLAAVSSMEFSPWSPKLFLTCGNDWCIRIWLEGILKPLIILRNAIGPIHCASWSRTHSTIIVAANRKSIDIWDLRRNIMKPVSTHSFGDSHNTEFKFSNCGRSIAVGNECGNVALLAFEDMPFPAHFQYEQLEAALLNALVDDIELTKEVKSFGYVGFPDDSKRQKPKKIKKKKR